MAQEGSVPLLGESLTAYYPDDEFPRGGLHELYAVGMERIFVVDFDAAYVYVAPVSTPYMVCSRLPSMALSISLRMPSIVRVSPVLRA